MKEEIMGRLLEAVRVKVGPECDAVLHGITTNNGIRLYGISVRERGKTGAVVICIGSLLDRIEKCSITIQGAADEVIKDFNERRRDAERLSGAVGSLDKEGILKKVVYQVIGKERNTGMLENIPHEEMLDLAAVYRVVLDENDSETASLLLNDSFCRHYGISSDELVHAARRNTLRQGFKVTPITTLLAGSTGLPEETFEETCPPMYVITSMAMNNGAAIMLYKGYMDRLACKLGSDLYILPSSVHEVIAVPAGRYSPRELRDMVREINAGGSISEDEILSNSVYFYSLKKGELRIA